MLQRPVASYANGREIVITFLVSRRPRPWPLRLRPAGLAGVARVGSGRPPALALLVF